MNNEAYLIIALVIGLVVFFAVLRRIMVKKIKGTIKKAVYSNIKSDEMIDNLPKEVAKDIRDTQATDTSRYESSATTIVDNFTKTYPTNCPNCGGNLNGKSNKCPYCGTKF